MPVKKLSRLGMCGALTAGVFAGKLFFPLTPVFISILQLQPKYIYIVIHLKYELIEIKT